MTPSTGADPTRAVLQAKVDAGASVEWLHERTNVAPALLRAVLDGQVDQVPVHVADRVLELKGQDPPKARPPRPARGVPAGPVREHL